LKKHLKLVANKTTILIYISVIRRRTEAMPMTAKQMIKLVKQNGFKEVKQEGAHVKLYNPETRKTIIVPVHNGDLKKGTDQGILKDAGIE
jgi:predicted RNA binding protein YcfA (HicA-like mRNA interferase family)